MEALTGGAVSLERDIPINDAFGLRTFCRCPVKNAHIRQPRPDSGLVLEAKVLKPLQGVLSSLGSGQQTGQAFLRVDASLSSLLPAFW